MVDPIPLPTVIEKSKTTKLGTSQRIDIRLDIAKQTQSDIRAMMIGIAVHESQEQTAIGNPPQRVIVDGRENKNIKQVNKKIEIYFGVKLAQVAMTTVESALLSAINKSTTAKTGRLKDIRGSWEWTLVQGGRSRVIQSADEIQSFGYRDYLMLKPKLPYATIVSNVIADTGKVKRRAKKQSINMGILGYAAQKAKRTAALRDFTVYASRTRDFMVPGEKSTTGTGYITIRAKRARRYRSLI